MNSNHRANSLNNQLPHRRRRAAYLLGMGPIPPPTKQEIAVALFNRLLDEPQAEGLEVPEESTRGDNIHLPPLHNHYPMLPPVINGTYVFLIFMCHFFTS